MTELNTSYCYNIDNLCDDEVCTCHRSEEHKKRITHLPNLNK